MVNNRNINIFFFLLAGFLVFSLNYKTYASSCDEIAGVWKWDNGDFTTFNFDGSIESDYAEGQAGTWECENASIGIFKIKWNMDTFNSAAKFIIFSNISSVKLSNDGNGLTIEPGSVNNGIKSAEKMFSVVYPKEHKNKNADNFSIPVTNLPAPNEIISVGSCPGENCNPIDQDKLGVSPEFTYQNSPSEDSSSHWSITLLKATKTAFDSLTFSISNNDLRGTIFSLLFLAVCIFIIVFLINILRDFLK